MSNKPYVICHMMQTIDGKIASGIDGVEILMDYFHKYVDSERELNGNVFMFGRKTAEMFAKSSNNTYQSNEKTDLKDNIVNKNNENFVVVTDLGGKLDWKDNYIKLSGNDKQFYLIIIVGKDTPKEFVEKLKSQNISLIHLDDENSLYSGLKKLKSNFNISKIILEGGGNLNGSMLSEDLIDELSLLITPIAANRKDAPSLFNSQLEFIKTKRFQLIGCKQIDEVVHLMYKKRLSD